MADDGGARLVIGAWPQLTPGDQGGLIRWQRLVTSLRGLLGAELCQQGSAPGAGAAQVSAGQTSDTRATLAENFLELIDVI